MKYPQNLHTHTTYCDGKNSAEEIILKAIELGFDTIGFSGHSPVPIDLDYFMSEDSIENYKSEICYLKNKYKDKIKVLCGIEYDMFSNTSQEGYDYIIGSNHHLMIDGKLIDMDQNITNLTKIIDTYFDGSSLAFAKKYYEISSQIPEKVNADFIAHIDLLTKNCELADFLDTESKEYRNAALNAIHTIAEKVNVFEVNTGAISRGYRKTPYPAPFILKEINNIGGHVIITSDCHNKDFLDNKFDTAIELIKECGFKEIYTFTDTGFKGVSIKQFM